MKKPITAKNYFLTLTIISFAQSLVLAVFSGVVFYLIYSGDVIPDKNLQVPFQYAVPIGFVTMLMAGHLLFRNIVAGVSPGLPLKEKMTKYLSAVIIRAALIEAAGFLAAVAAMLTGELYFLVAALLGIFILMLLRPGQHSIAEDLRLSPEEKNTLQNPEAVIAEM